ncbi:MAG: hypothetical protein F6K10_07925 [Moorea sp. SIO2B7]|nr:hypothetical protein [Moorena sp. SIO2B7]
MVKKIALICLAMILGLAIVFNLTPVQSSSHLESRLSRLEAGSSQMRSRINRLESEISRLRGKPSSPSPSPPQSRERQVYSSEPMFDRLATLVIELKERIKVLEADVAQLKNELDNG